MSRSTLVAAVAAFWLAGCSGASYRTCPSSSSCFGSPCSPCAAQPCAYTQPIDVPCACCCGAPGSPCMASKDEIGIEPVSAVSPVVGPTSMAPAQPPFTRVSGEPPPPISSAAEGGPSYGGGGGGGGGTNQGSMVVEIRDHAFSPETITILQGDTVTWTNRDAVAHAMSRSGAPEFDLLVPSGEQRTFRFTQVSGPGGFEYACRLHPKAPHGHVVVLPQVAVGMNSR